MTVAFAPMKFPVARLFVAAGLGLVGYPAAPAQDTKITKPMPALGERVTVNLVAKVETLNLKTREITLRGPLGHVVSLTVDERIKRLDEFKVGDELAIGYSVTLAAEIRPATEEEKKNALKPSDEVIRAPDRATPLGAARRTITAAVTVEGVDRAAKTTTLKGPRGNWTNIRVKDPALLDSLRVGDTVVVTYSEAVAVELKKADSAPAK